MAQLPGFQLIEKLHEGKNSLVYRARRESDTRPVVLKMLAEAYPSPERLAWFRREYETTRSLGDVDGVIQALELHREQQRWFMVLEDFGGNSLARLMKQQRIPLQDTLRMASTLAAILAKLQERHVIHKDINPSNLVLNPATGQLKLIDFGISTVLARENPTLKDPSRLEGTLAYISPEQTGRMNRAIDYRTDFYSLGVTLYELVTGQLPFKSADALELVHSHLARQPPPPHELQPGVDRAFSDVIMRLLAKNAENRYQSSYGLLRDLEDCQKRQAEGRRMEPFVVGREDVSHRFQLPQKLYGREQETQQMLEAFERVAAGASELMLISGYSGIGKSALVREIYKPVTRQRGYLISGKFDQMVRDEPYAPLLQAFRELIRQVLSESRESIARWRNRLTEALSSNGRIITDVIPDVEAIIGPQPAVPELKPNEAKTRFHLVFQSFIKVFAGREHPLALFIDDLQWVDEATLSLLQALMAGEGNNHLLLIGAYRDNEVTDTHPLTLSLRQLRKAGMTIRELALQPLSVAHVRQLIQDALARTSQDTLPLAQLAHDKTRGNPFFLGEFLKHLHSEQLLRFDLQSGWTWNLEQIAARNVTDNVVAFMASKVQRLAPECQRVLQLAACTGNVFALRTLATISERTLQETATSLWDALADGLLQPLNDAYKLTHVDMQDLLDTVNVEYRFTHDRIQQAAYSLIPQEERRHIHWRVGKLLWENTPADALAQRVFDIVNQLDHCLEFLRERGERDELAQLYLQAGRKAKASAAYEQALHYLRSGIRLLAEPAAANSGAYTLEDVEEAWSRQYRLCLDLFDEAAELAYLCGEYEETQRLIQAVLSHARSVLDKVRSYKTEVQSLSARKELRASVEAGLKALRQLGIDIPAAPSSADMAPIAATAAAIWAGRNTDEFVSPPEMTDPEKLAAMEIMARLYIPAYNAMPEVYKLIVYHKVILTGTHGLALSSPRGMVAYAFMLCLQGEIEAGYRFGRLALRMAERFRGADLSSTHYMFHRFVRYWRESAKEAEPFLTAYRFGLESGDLEYAALNLFGALSQPFWSGEELSALAASAASYDRTLRNLKQEWPREVISIHWQSILNLLGRSAKPSALVGEAFDEGEKLPAYEKAQNPTALGLFYLNKLALCYVFGDFEQALSCGRIAEKYMRALTVPIFMMGFRFFDALASLACCREGSPRAELLARADADLELLRAWARHAPGNFAQKAALVEAERARVLGQASEARELYDRAITLAQKHQFVWDEALAHELAARFHRERGVAHLARHYLRDAHYAYQRWGATAKVNQLEASFRHEMTHAHPSTRTVLSAEGTATQEFASTGVLDLHTVLKASQALAGELALDKLLARLLTTVLENAGAQRALLLLEKNGELVIEAEGSVEGEQMQVLQSLPVSASEKLLQAIVHLVARSGRAEVVNDASTEGMFIHEPYVQHKRSKSILCIPLINQGKQTAILYLENNLVSGAFTHERLELLNLLSGEMAIAIDHARLYRALEVANKELADYSHTLEEKVSARTRELADKNQELQLALVQLREAQRMLILREKMASLGRLAAGVAHELRNPLNFIINFAELSKELTLDATQELEEYRATPDSRRMEDVKNLLSDMAGYAERIAEHGKRANSIIGSMLTHSLANTDKRVATNVNQLLSEAVQLSYQAIRSRDSSFKAELVETYDDSIGPVELVPQELSRVFINMIENACYSTQKKRQQAGEHYAPEISVRTNNRQREIELRIRDNGIGIARENLDQIFQPFFTTKPPGEGTGLGLSICYDIVVHKHRGDIRVTSQEGDFAEFTITLPKDPVGEQVGQAAG
jgi:predicted ATPase/signal transduction histidine kinase/tRNA A-37 threonylcarbamoyl transferase component Bud32